MCAVSTKEVGGRGGSSDVCGTVPGASCLVWLWVLSSGGRCCGSGCVGRRVGGAVGGGVVICLLWPGRWVRGRAVVRLRVAFWPGEAGGLGRGRPGVVPREAGGSEPCRAGGEKRLEWARISFLLELIIFCTSIKNKEYA